MKSVCLVGNSEGVLKRPLGTFINLFDIVIRFNGFVTDGYEPWVGHKTDYVVLHDNFMNLSKTIHKNKKIIGIPYFKHHPKETLPSDQILWIPFAGTIPKNEKCWHTGIHVVSYFNKLEGHEIYVHGMGDGGISHYYNQKFRVWRGHDPEYEGEWLDENGIKRLSDYFDL